jgi:RimJ/RimL family protein N-acetyltransferase
MTERSSSAEMPTNGTQRLIIRLLERRDIEDARVLHNEDATLARLTDIQHVSELQQDAWFQAISVSRTARRYVARRRTDDAFVGVFRIDRLDLINRNAYVGADVTPALRGQGHAGEMFEYFLAYLFDQYGLHRVSLVTLATNSPALSLYRKLGFVEEGRERQAIFRNGRFQDLIAMGLLADEWRGASAQKP